YGMVHANGGNATKHSVAVYSNEPPERFARVDAQEHVDSQARPELPADWSGRVSIEAATVVYDREGPSHVFAAIRSEEGPRGWATSRDTDLIDQTIRAGLANRPGRRSPGGELLA
ncbi:MAG: hypothetical protein ACR2KC_07470, partial [Acidimicrobiales bacterium]